MKIALVQSNIHFEEKEKNLLRATSVISEEAERGADLILFPEMSFTGFSMHTEIIGERCRETVKRLSELAAASGVAIGFGWVAFREKEPEVVDGGSAADGKKLAENRYTIIGKNGNVISEFTKLHPFSYAGEDYFYRGGENVVEYELEGIPCSTFICYDLRFPEAFRKVGERAHMVLVPANWPASRAEHWKTLLRARAIENQVYILGINCVGHMNGQDYSGDSCVITPDGNVQASLSGEEGVVRYELQDNVEEYRKGFPVWKDYRNMSS
ncbi:MAG: carbon-nitrogen family hydrolase [Eubacterium sp.]|nr:carbon-nitrogen family hydrolase [Eubacterium sp.]